MAGNFGMRIFRNWFRISTGMSTKPSPEHTPKYKNLLDLATKCFGDADKAHDWLVTPHAALGHKPPIDLAEDGDEGYQAVVDEIGRIEHGIFA